MSGSVDNLFGSFFIKRTFWRHAADYTAATHSHVGFFVGKQNSRADCLVTAAGGIGSVDSGNNRYSHLFQFGMAEKACSLTAAIRINLFLFGKFNTGTIHQPDKWNMRILAMSVTRMYELGVGYILEGSARRAGDRVRITAQLVQVEDQTHIWAETYDRKLEDVFDIQTDVAERIARSLAVELLPEAQALIARSSTRSSEAYELYLHGRHYSSRRGEEYFAKALEFYSRAIREGPPLCVGLQRHC